MNTDSIDIIVDFLYDSEEDEPENLQREEINIHLFVEESSEFEKTVNSWINDELAGCNFNEGSFPLEVSCATVALESIYLRGKR